ncbi:MAG: hypothetical protein GY817_04635 [bacterium]|nr:hypothetical protein [bacterium]
MDIEFTKDTILIRAKTGDYDDNGDWQEAENTEIIIKACVLPYKFRNLTEAPEGSHMKAKVKVYTKDELKVKDIIKDKDVEYLITEVNDYTCESFDLPHYLAIGERIKK